MAEWLKTWATDSNIRSSVHKAWPTIVSQVRAIAIAQRSRHIRGPMSAIIVLLSQCGWDPISPSRWHLPSDGCNSE
eukprot:6007362-Pyramimonas_sp.AAC.1